jgi:hypothetical protein
VSRINIKVKQVKAANKELVNLTSRVDGVGNQISSVRHQVDGRIASRRSIGRNLNEAAAKVREAEMKLKKIHQFVDVSMDLYVKADKKADRFKEPEKKSTWDKMKDMFGTANDVVSGFRKGLAEAVFSTVEGIWNAITHPIETAKGIVYAVSHPVETAKSIWKSISDSWKNDVINGDAKSRSQWFGRAIGEVALAIIGTKGVDKAVKMAKGARVVEEAGGVRIVKPENIEKKDGGAAVEKRVTPEKKDSGVGVEKRDASQKLDWKGSLGEDKYNGTLNPKYSFNMIENPGPLFDINPGAITTFRSGMYNVIELDSDTILYRSGKAGGGKNALGQYFTREPGTRIEGRIDSAVKAQWIDPKTGVLTGSSPLDTVYAIKIPKGTIMYEGPAGYQGGIYLGGGNQIFISQPWRIKGVEVISSTPIK